MAIPRAHRPIDTLWSVLPLQRYESLEQLPHTVVPLVLVQTPFKCFHIDQQIATASDERSATSVSVSCAFLSVLSCECVYTWVRNLLQSFSGLMVAAYQYSVSCV